MKELMDAGKISLALLDYLRGRKMVVAFCAFLFASFIIGGCTSPQYEKATAIGPSCVGYREENQCEAWARQFHARLKQLDIENKLVFFRWSQHGESINHMAVCWRDKDGWWYQDNIRGPVQVDSFGQYSWQEKVENALQLHGSSEYATAKELIQHGGVAMGGGSALESSPAISNVKVW